MDKQINGYKNLFFKVWNKKKQCSFYSPDTLNMHVDVPALLLIRHSYVPLLEGSSLNFSSGVSFRSGIDIGMKSPLRNQRTSVRRGGFDLRTVHFRVTICVFRERTSLKTGSTMGGSAEKTDSIVQSMHIISLSKKCHILETNLGEHNDQFLHLSVLFFFHVSLTSLHQSIQKQGFHSISQYRTTTTNRIRHDESQPHSHW